MSSQGTADAVHRHEQLGLSDGEVLDMYKYMLLARKFDERCLLLQRAGKINFHVSGVGQEAAQVGAAFGLDRDHDYYLPYYRDYGFVLAVGMTPRELMLSAFAKAEDPNSGGRQMPGHFGHKKLRIVTGSSPVTTQVPHAVGFALAAKMQKKNLFLLLRLVKAQATRETSTKELTSLEFTSCLLLLCVRITSTPSRFRSISSLAARYRIAHWGTASLDYGLTAMTRWKYMLLSKKRAAVQLPVKALP